MRKQIAINTNSSDLVRWVILLLVFGVCGYLMYTWLVSLAAKAKNELDILDVKINADNVSTDFVDNVKDFAAEAHKAFVELGFWGTMFDKEDAFVKRVQIADKLRAVSSDELKIFSNIYNNKYPGKTFLETIRENKGGLADENGSIDKLIGKMESLNLK